MMATGRSGGGGDYHYPSPYDPRQQRYLMNAPPPLPPNKVMNTNKVIPTYKVRGYL